MRIVSPGTGILMLTLSEWFTHCGGRGRDWLLLGKGPSFHLRNQFDLSPFLTLALNHVVRELVVTAAHLIDFDVFEACAQSIDRQAQFLLMPWRPHVRNVPGRWTLPDYVKRHPVLAKLEREGRLVGYHLSTGGRAAPAGQPVIEAKFFSAEAALRILAWCGVRRVRSLGIDGGTQYSEEFADLRDTTRLSNRRTSFDEQFSEIAALLHATGLDYAPLHVEAPIRVYVGTTASQELAFQVLAHSIRRHASMSVEIIPMRDLPVPIPKRPECRPRTPFSFSRFLIPALAGYRGRAVYLDADMLVFADIASLWQTSLNGADVLYIEQPVASARPDQFSVLLMNCETLRWNIEGIVRGLDDRRYAYEDLLHGFCVVPHERLAAGLPPSWNSLERYRAGETSLLHYTDMHRQPWVSLDNPRGHLWIAELIRAVREGRIPEALVEAEVRVGHVRPSLLEQVRRRRARGWWGLRRLDRAFEAPYRRLPTAGTLRAFHQRLAGRLGLRR